MITVLHWDHTTRTCVPGNLDQLPTTAAAVLPEDVWWIDLCNPTPEEEERIFSGFFPVHPLTQEDIFRIRAVPDQGSHFPKVEEFPDYLFVIVNPLPPGLALASQQSKRGEPAQEIKRLPSPDRKTRPQLSVVLNRQILVTHHYLHLDCVTSAQQFVNRHHDSAGRGPDFLFHQVLDAMVDEYAPVVDRVAARLDGLESRMFRDPTPEQLTRLLRIKRSISNLRKTLILEREVLARLTRGEFDLVDEREVVYYRNVYDHLVRYSELIEAAREMASDLMETHLTAVSTRLNQVMKVLTTISTVVLPMTLVAGVYGMNFKHMPDLEWKYGYPMSLGLMGLLGVGSILFFRWRRWL